MILELHAFLLALLCVIFLNVKKWHYQSILSMNYWVQKQMFQNGMHFVASSVEYVFLIKVQAALVIRGFVIRGFDYPQHVNCIQNSLSVVFSSVIRGFCPFWWQYGQYSCPSLFACLVFPGYSENLTSRITRASCVSNKKLFPHI